jgi:REP element-mobilizing transposase RayT
VQRGNDRLPRFFAETDYRRYLINLREAALKRDCAVHAYVLMINHVHPLVALNAAGYVSRMMQSLGRRYVSRIDTTCPRTGTLWEGRHKACLDIASCSKTPSATNGSLKSAAISNNNACSAPHDSRHTSTSRSTGAPLRRRGRPKKSL